MKKNAGVLFGLGLASFALNAHALCVNPDGSLDDPSVPPESVAMDVMPSCAPTAGGKSALPAAAAADASDKTARHDSGAGKPGPLAQAARK